MAIRMMTGRDDYEARATTGRTIEKVSDYHGHEEGMVRHSRSCVHYATDWRNPRTGLCIAPGHEIRPEGLRPECVATYEQEDALRKAGHRDASKCEGPFGALYMETTHVGLVLALGEYNRRDDSDFYALVWNAEVGRAERVEYATTRGWTYPNNAWVDATPDVVAAYEAWQAQIAADERARAEAKKAAEIAQLEAARTEAEALRGRTVTIIRGAGRGNTGAVTWVGPNRFGAGWRVGLTTAAGRVFANVCSVRAVRA